MFFTLRNKSDNRKTGKCAVIRCSPDTCPKLCPLKESGCYCKSIVYINYRWKRMNAANSLSLDDLCAKIRNLPSQTVIRYADAGDLPGDGYGIDRKSLDELDRAIWAIEGRAFTYTHYLSGAESRLSGHYDQNLAILLDKPKQGLTINISCEDLDNAIFYSRVGFPTTCTVMSHWSKKKVIYEGRKFIMCPAIYNDKAQCISCGGKEGPLCFQGDRDFTIVFPAHGPAAKKVDTLIKERNKRDRKDYPDV